MSKAFECNERVPAKQSLPGLNPNPLGSTFGNYPHVKDAHGNATRMHCGKYLCWLGSYGAQRDTFDATQIDLL